MIPCLFHQIELSMNFCSLFADVRKYADPFHVGTKDGIGKGTLGAFIAPDRYGGCDLRMLKTKLGAKSRDKDRRVAACLLTTWSTTSQSL